MKYAFIEDRLADADNPHRLNILCRMLSVSRSGYYDWRERHQQPDPDTVALEVAAAVQALCAADPDAQTRVLHVAGSSAASAMP